MKMFNYNRLESKWKEMKALCLKFFSSYTPVKIIKSDSSSERDVVPEEDIVSEFGGFELGSYGIKKYNDFIWIYGTGCAEPRLTEVIKSVSKPGYHNELIPKTEELGSVFKIIEEYDEFIDAIKSKNKIMGLVELSDLLGAIEFYLKEEFKMDLSDLKIMSDTTKRAFINGRR